MGLAVGWNGVSNASFDSQGGERSRRLRFCGCFEGMSLPQSRRRFLGAGLTALGASALSRAVAAELPSAPKPKSHVNPFVYHFNLGAIEAWSISDGHMLFNDRVDKMWPPEQRPAMLQALAAHGERTDGMPLYVNILVLKRGREVVIFDGGFGVRADPNTGWVADGLKSIGIATGDVTQAILSHGHSDHIGGFVAGGKPMFPNAALHVMKAEVDFWRGPAPDFSRSHRRDSIPGLIRAAREALDVLQPNLQLHRDGDQILNGAITFEAAPGHTDGHCALRVKDGAESLVHFMDLAHNHVLMFADPAWYIEFDHEPEGAVATRRKIFGRLAATGERAFGFHLPWPGLGRVLPKGNGFQGELERWSWGS
jgi:glyoxylase-like metal-dependent hydrolase (beta-lactamase superfamily II)